MTQIEKIKKNDIPPLFTAQFSGFSMYPFLKPGDKLVVRHIDPHTLRLGDIAVVNNKHKLVIHRLVKILPDSRCLTKGDSMLFTDPGPIEFSAIRGKVVAIIRDGKFISLSRGPRSFMKKLYSLLSLKGLTIGAIKLRIKNSLKGTHPKKITVEEESRRLIDLLRGHPIKNFEDIVWPRLLDAADKEGVTGIIYTKIRNEAVPSHVLDILKNRYRSIAAQNMIRMHALEKLEAALNIAEIEVMTLKGSSMLDNVYEMGMRPMGDLDLMVRTEHKDSFCDVLNRLGYSRDPFNSHIFKTNGLTIDLHIHALNIDRIASRTNLFPKGMEPVWENSIPWKEGFRWIRRPDDQDNILLLSLHFMKHSFWNLIWLIDIFLLIKNRGDLFWKRLAERCHFYRQERCLAYSFYLIEKMFDCFPPKGSGLEYISSQLSMLDRKVLDARIRGEPFSRLGNILAFNCLSGPRNRIRFLIETIFLQNHIITQEFGDFSGMRRILFYSKRLFLAILILFRFIFSR